MKLARSTPKNSNKPAVSVCGEISIMPLIMFMVAVRSRASIPVNANKRNTSQKDNRPIRWETDWFVPDLASEDPVRTVRTMHQSGTPLRNAEKNLDEPADSQAKRKER
jgi:hypothetical protein